MHTECLKVLLLFCFFLNVRESVSVSGTCVIVQGTEQCGCSLEKVIQKSSGQYLEELHGEDLGVGRSGLGRGLEISRRAETFQRNSGPLE